MRKSLSNKQKSLQLNLIILGDVAAGKATQSAYFAKKYKLFDFDMGKELTLRRQKDHKLESIQKRTADKGILTPTKVVKQINQQIITGLPSNKGILFDGHPKMIGEARLVKQLLDKTKRSKPLVLYLTIPVAETVKRMEKRRGYAGTKVKKRSDDTVAGLKNRAKYYQHNIKQVIQYFANHYTFARIDGLGTKSEVRKRIQKAISFYLKNYEQIYKAH